MHRRIHDPRQEIDVTTPRLARFAAFVIAAWSFAAGADMAPTVAPKRTVVDGAPVKSVLWVGTSFFYFNNGFESFMRGLAGAAGDGLAAVNTIATIGAAGIDAHDVDAYLRPDSRIGAYTFLPNNDVRFEPPGRRYDTVVLLDCSQCPIHPQLKAIFHDYAKRDSDIARKYGVRPVFFMSWAYKDKPEMTAQLADAYATAANANDALVIPAGLAFARSLAARPDLEIYQPDKRHPSRAGTYLAACTAYAALTGHSPVGNKFDAGLGAEVAGFLQQVAWDTVRAYYGAK
jgi:hypothetical protein